MDELIQKLKEKVTEASASPDFVHHEWFIEHHLNIVEKIALELCEKYPEADKYLVLALVLIHDYPKIKNKEREHDMQFAEEIITPLLQGVGFQNEFVEKVIKHYVIFESKMTEDLSSSPIEVQIASSADAASHFFGPFFSIYFKEKSTETMEYLCEASVRKILKDWERKIVLPEIKEIVEPRKDFMLTLYGDLPEKFLK